MGGGDGEVLGKRIWGVTQLHGVRVGTPPKFEPVSGEEFTLDVDLVLIAMGFSVRFATG